MLKNMYVANATSKPCNSGDNVEISLRKQKVMLNIRTTNSNGYSSVESSVAKCRMDMYESKPCNKNVLPVRKF